MSEESVLKKLDDVLSHLAHIQRRIDALQGCVDSLYPYVINAQVRLEHPNESGDRLEAFYAVTLDQYLKRREEAIAKYSEFPFLTGELPPDISPPTS